MPLDGSAAMVKKFRNFVKKYPDEVGRAMYQVAQVMATEVKERTPVATGTLRSSVFVTTPVRTGSGAGSRVTVQIVCGGSAAPYAIYVHENLKAHHAVGQAKFLESVIMENRTALAGLVMKQLQANRAMLNALVE